MFYAVRIFCIASSLALSAAVGVGAENADEPGRPTNPRSLPRYRLQVGQQLEYEVNNSVKLERSETRLATESRCLVVATNEDGSWRILLSETGWSGRGAGPIVKDAKRARPHTLAYFDLYADGRIARESVLGSPTVRRIFPRLPDDQQQLTTGWSAESTAGTHGYRIESQKDDHTRFSDVETGPLFDFLQWTYKTTYRFDHRRGLVDGASGESSRGVRPAFDGTSEINLIGSEVLSGEAISKLADETRAYFDAADDYRRQMKQAAKDAQRSEQLSAQAKERLQLAASLFTAPMLKAHAEATLGSHDATAKRASDTAGRRAKIVGNESPDFEATDLDGHPFSLKALRGKVVVLDFWYRACEPCIVAMGQVKKTARSFQGKPVAVVGMNTDGNIDDAKYVVEKIRLEYTNVRAEGAPEKFHIEVFPGLIVIDQKGMVREYHEGAVPTLAADLTETIDALLAEP